MDMISPVTPGEILLEEYLRPMGISQNAMARAIGVPPRAVNEIVLGKRSITPAMSIRFGAFFGQTDGFWHGLQVEAAAVFDTEVWTASAGAAPWHEPQVAAGAVADHCQVATEPRCAGASPAPWQ